MIGRDKNRTFWRVLKIDRLESSELNIIEDSTVYSETECCDLLRRIHEGNKSTGGLKFVTTCYGIIGIFYLLYNSKIVIIILVLFPALFTRINPSSYGIFLFRIYQIS